jgi:hypothetical protein
MLPDNAHGLITAASSRMDTRRVKDFEFAAKQALKNRNVFVIEESRKRGPVTSYPVIVEWPNKGEEIVGVINIGTVPADLDFFRDLAIQAAMGLVNARLYRELEKSKQSLEKRVNQLLTLSQMSLALQGIRSAAAKAERDDHIILAKNLVMAGFDRALVYDLDLIAKRLGPGVGSHKGIAVNERLSLSRYKSEHALIQAILRPAEPDSGLGMVLPAKTITPPERRLLKKTRSRFRRYSLGQTYRRRIHHWRGSGFRNGDYTGGRPPAFHVRTSRQPDIRKSQIGDQIPRPNRTAGHDP